MVVSPDVALMDIRLADGSGVNVARELHTRMAVRCIFVSANLDEPTRTLFCLISPSKSSESLSSQLFYNGRSGKPRD
jgi:CheY-like chemotaxis protein